MHSGVIKGPDKPLWFDVYEAFPPKRAPLYVKPLSRRSGRKVAPVAPVAEIFYREDEVRA